MSESDYREWEQSQELKGRTVRREGELRPNPPEEVMPIGYIVTS